MPKEVPNHQYTGDFKQMVVETMMTEKLSYRETAKRFENGNQSHVVNWERIYLMEGPEGLCIERCGRSSKGRPGTKARQKGLPPALHRQQALSAA